MFLNQGSIVLCGLLTLVWTENVGSSLKVLSRKRRYVTFPEGSSFSAAGCMTVGLIGQPAPSSTPGTFTFGLNWGIAYELPNATETLAFYHKKKGRKPMAQRRSRRELYGKIEDILDNMGYSGRQCILKTLCETTQRIVPHGNNMVEEIFRLCSRYHYPKCFLKNRWSIPYTMQHIAWELYWKIVTFTNVPCP
ncbi:uncharacterized protein [Choristoneura fumiferana]|uniref:uncharacterized protein n=1 Tax=Choristoneura fumiferana TaxID=7141 RepID=UPI003D15AC95